MLNPNLEEVAVRIRALREDLGFTPEEMAEATNRSVEEYIAQESGEKDMSFTFLYKCAEKFGIDVIEILTGENPHLRGYSLVRAGDGLSIERHPGFEYLHIAPTLKIKLAEPFIVTIPPSEEPVDTENMQLSRHEGQELDYILSGRIIFSYEGRIEELGPGDCIMYDSGRGHGLEAIGGEPCVLLAVVIHPQERKEIPRGEF